MSQESLALLFANLFAIFGVGVALAGFLWNIQKAMHADIAGLRERMTQLEADLRERMSRLEGLLEGFTRTPAHQKTDA